MENMKAVQVHNYGGPEVLHFEDAPRPTPGSGELLVRVLAASVNAIDWKARAGYMKDVFPLPLPYIPGWDVSGIVEAIGPGVTQFKKGDEVYAVPDGARSGKGTYAEYVVVISQCRIMSGSPPPPWLDPQTRALEPLLCTIGSINS